MNDVESPTAFNPYVELALFGAACHMQGLRPKRIGKEHPSGNRAERRKAAALSRKLAKQSKRRARRVQV